MGLQGSTVQLLPLLTGVGRGATAAITARTEARAIRAQESFERRALEAQARALGRQAGEVRDVGRRLEAQQRQRTRQVIGAQRAALAAQGINIETGSAAELQTETAAFGALDAATIRNNAFRQALGLELGIEDIRLQQRLGGLAAETKAQTTLVTGGLNFLREVQGGIKTTPKLQAPRVQGAALFRRTRAPGGRLPPRELPPFANLPRSQPRTIIPRTPSDLLPRRR